MLAWVLERAGGLFFPELLSHEIWSVLGAEHDASISVDPDGVAVASAGLNLTLRDLGRFASMHLHEGSLGDRRILPAGVVRACRSGSRSAFANERNTLRVVPRLSRALIAYSRQFWIFEKGYAMLGNNGQSVMILPDSQLVAIKLSSIPNDKPSVIFQDQFNAYQAACALAQKYKYLHTGAI